MSITRSPPPLFPPTLQFIISEEHLAIVYGGDHRAEWTLMAVFAFILLIVNLLNTILNGYSTPLVFRCMWARVFFQCCWSDGLGVLLLHFAFPFQQRIPTKLSPPPDSFPSSSFNLHVYRDSGAVAFDVGRRFVLVKP